MAVVEYDGTDFHGSQLQPGRRTVQGELEAALSSYAGAPVRASFAGRTDSGVHAAGQVVAFELDRTASSEEVARAATALLPRDVAVREAMAVCQGFDPRRWATGRRYRYCILNRRRRSPLAERFALHVGARLDEEAMREAGALLIGYRDFGAFGRPTQGDNTWRHVRCLEVTREADRITIVAEANAFLRHMVRLIVGALVDVGRGKYGPEELQAVLSSPEKPSPSPAVAAKGLLLEAVSYDRERLGLGRGPWWSSEPLDALAWSPSDNTVV